MEQDADAGGYTTLFRPYDEILGRWKAVDPLQKECSWMSSYNFGQNSPLSRIDPSGAIDNPIYDTDGNFLGTDDKGLQGEARVLDKKDFKQGMSSNLAKLFSQNKNDLAPRAEAKMMSHYSNLKNRPDYDGYVTLTEGIEWAKAYPNSANDYDNPNIKLYVDASKLDLGNIYMNVFGDLEPGSEVDVQTFTGQNLLAASTNSSIRSTVYALGSISLRLENREERRVSIVDNDAAVYDWNQGGGFMRRAGIGFERLRNNLNDTHSFRVSYYGTAQLRKQPLLRSNSLFLLLPKNFLSHD